MDPIVEELRESGIEETGAAGGLKYLLMRLHYA